MDKRKRMNTKDVTQNEDELREILYFQKDNQVEFGVEQAHGYPFNGGWVYPDLEAAETISCEKDEDPLKKYTK